MCIRDRIDLAALAEQPLDPRLAALQVFAVEARYEEGPFPLPASREELLALLESELERCELAVSRCVRRTGI